MPIITTPEEVKQFSSIASSFPFEKLKKFILPAEEKYIRQAIGKDMYSDLVAYYDQSILSENAVDMSAMQLALWQRACNALMDLVLFHAAADLDVTVSQAGIQRIENANSKTAYQYQLIAWRNARRDQGFDGLDSLIGFLEENIDDAAFLSYKNSAERAEWAKLFVRNADDFNEYAEVRISRWIFLQLFPIMKRIERDIVKPELADYDDIKNELADGTLTADHQTILEDFVRPAIVHRAFAEAIIPLSVRIDERGVTFFNNTGGSKTEETYQPVPGNRLHELKTRWERLSEVKLEQLRLHIDPLAADEEYPVVDHPLDADQQGFMMM